MSRALTHPPRPRAYAATDCSVVGCSDPVQARGWCHKHYQHWLTYGDPITSTRAPSTTLTAQDLLEFLNGRATFRQIDYWLRTGTIAIADQPRGSGDHRQFTRDEATAIGRFVEELNATNAQLERLRSGERFAELVAEPSDPEPDDGYWAVYDERGERVAEA